MSDFEVNIPGIQTEQTDLIGIGRKLIFTQVRLETVKNSLRGSISQPGYAEIQKSLGNISKSIRNQMEHTQKLSVGLKQISDTYIKTEKSILNSMNSDAPQIIPKPIFPNSWKFRSFMRLITPASAGALISTTAFGIPVSGSIGAGYLGGELTGKTGFGVKKKDGKVDSVGIFAEGTASGYIGEIHGKAKNGISEISGSAKFITGGATGSIGLSLVKDGKFTPQAVAKAKAEVAAASGKIENKMGNDDYNFHTNAKGKALSAEAEAQAGAGVITMTDENGKEYSTIGVEAGVKAEACVAKGEVSQGFTIMGIKFDVGVEGKVLSAGAHAGVKANTGGIKGNIGASLLLGIGLNFSIDWTGFHFPW